MLQKNDKPLKLLLTAKQAADALEISRRKLYSLTVSGEIAHVKIGRSIRYPVKDLQKWVESQTSVEYKGNQNGNSKRN